MNHLLWILMAACVACSTCGGCGGSAQEHSSGAPSVERTTVDPASIDRTPTSGAASTTPATSAPGDASVDERGDEPTTPVVPQSDRTRAERQHRAAESAWEKLLGKRIDVDLVDIPLPDALADLARRAGAPGFSIDEPALTDERIDVDVAITLTEKGITVGQALWRMLDPLELTWHFEDEGPVVTTLIRANEHLTTRTWSGADVRAALSRHHRHQGRTRVVDHFTDPDADEDPDPFEGALSDLLQSQTPGPWQDIDGTGGTISFLDSIVTVRQTRPNQEQIAWLLRIVEQYARGEFQRSSAEFEPPWVPLADAHALDAGLGRPIARVAWKETPLRDALRSLARETGLRLYLDERALNDEGVELDAPVTFSADGLTLRTLLNRTLRPLNATALAHHGFLRVTSIVRADELLRPVVYDVRDLVEFTPGNFGPLIDLVMQETAGPWMDIDGTGGTNEAILEGCLVVRQSENCHLEIAALFEDLRSKLDLTEPQAIRDPPTNADADGLELRIYPLKSAALAASLAGCLLDLSPESWSARGGKGTIHAVDTALAVRQTRPVHARIVQFLSDMRRAGVDVGP